MWSPRNRFRTFANGINPFFFKKSFVLMERLNSRQNMDCYFFSVTLQVTQRSWSVPSFVRSFDNLHELIQCLDRLKPLAVNLAKSRKNRFKHFSPNYETDTRISHSSREQWAKVREVENHLIHCFCGSSSFPIASHCQAFWLGNSSRANVSSDVKRL